MPFLYALTVILAILSIAILLVYLIHAFICLTELGSDKKKRDLKFPFLFLFLFIESYSAWAFCSMLYSTLEREQSVINIIACVVMGGIFLFTAAMHVLYHLYTKAEK